MPHASDMQHMRHALRLAARGLGRTWPNPSVGAVVVRDGAIIARGVTARGGRPHAETVALAQAGEAARGATLYVSLEPCAHQGQTPPCTGAIIHAGIARVVGACADPNPQVAGKGFAQLRAAGIEVMENICAEEARKLNEGFFSVLRRKRPFVTLKLATSLDDKITRGEGEGQWITNALSRARAHGLRATHDAILTGIGTVLADDPLLTCRLPGLEADSPQRVVLDTHLRLPENAKILPAWIFASQDAVENNAAKVSALQARGARIFPLALSMPSPPPSGRGALPLATIVERLAREGVTRLLVEAGNALAGAFVQENLTDRIYWFRAPVVIGEKGLSALSTGQLPHFTLRGTDILAEDRLEIFEADA